MVEIKWYGHACFRLKGKDATILTDPVPRSLGYKVERQKADIVTISHAHAGHTNLDLFSAPPKIVEGPGEYEMNDVFITGIRTWHDNEHGALHGTNTAYLITLDEIRICHLGDLGHTLSNEQVEQLSGVDVLIIPVGGGPVLDAARAVEVISQIEPRITIPMQYRTEQGDAGREPLEVFLRAMGVSAVAPRDKLILKTAAELPDVPEVVVLTV